MRARRYQEEKLSTALQPQSLESSIFPAMPTKPRPKKTIASKTKVIEPVQKNTSPEKAASEKGEINLFGATVVARGRDFNRPFSI
jgi:hypothetical protein